MKPLDAEADAYGLAFVEARKSILETTKNVPWVDIRLEYDGLFRQVWIWVLVEDVEHARSTYDCLVGTFRILDINENRCDLNLSILCRLPGEKSGYFANLSGKQDVIDFNHQQVSERDMIVVSDAWQPSALR